MIIAGAGGAAHLPGMLASVTAAAGHRRAGPAGQPGRAGLAAVHRADAGRIPVATVAVGGARNAGLLAVRILGAADSPQGAELRTKLAAFAGNLADQARAKGAALRGRRP